MPSREAWQRFQVTKLHHADNGYLSRSVEAVHVPYLNE